MAHLVIEAADPRSPDARRLITALDEALNATYDPSENYLLDVDRLAAPDMRFFLALANGVAVGCAALRIDADGYGEVKRMFVDPPARGTGVGRRLLERLEGEARGLNLPRLMLETGVKQPEALALYRAAGFHERGPFADYPPLERSVFLEKSLTGFSHFDTEGRALMVDVSEKTETERTATARGSVIMQPATLRLIHEGGVKKGDVLSVARLAGIMGAKRTPDLIPLCHPLALTGVTVDLTLDPDRNAVDITATCKLKGRTGVEMEALTAVSVAALTVYDMCKAVDRGMVLTDIRLVHKAGGKSGEWVAAS
ncbi:molybdenum cofactor biosynthesis protein MoaC [Azospirillum fermentarium]|nr:molybdenum cofactor biosynthesis protein MoaC [Azospirillum fermentarium]